MSLNEVMLSQWHHVEVYYRHPDGAPSNEQANIKGAMRPPMKLYNDILAIDFVPLETWQGLLTVAGLRAGRSAAREVAP